MLQTMKDSSSIMRLLMLGTGVVVIVAGLKASASVVSLAIMAVVLAFAQFGLPMAVAIALGYLIINQIIEQLVAPKVIADDVSLSPTLTFFAHFFWGWVFNFLGVMLAAPLTVLIIMILQSYPETRWLAIMAIADEGKRKEKESDG